MNLRQPSDPLLAFQAASLWPIALRFPRIPRVPMEVPAARMRAGPWSRREVARLRRLWRSDAPAWTIYATLNRTPSAIGRKAFVLGLRRPGYKPNLKVVE